MSVTDSLETYTGAPVAAPQLPVYHYDYNSVTPGYCSYYPPTYPAYLPTYRVDAGLEVYEQQKAYSTTVTPTGDTMTVLQPASMPAQPHAEVIPPIQPLLHAQESSGNKEEDVKEEDGHSTSPISSEESGENTPEMTQSDEQQITHEKLDTQTTTEDSKSSIKSDTTPATRSDGKPTMSYIALIATAIQESAQKRLSLGSIYSWIEERYPYYKDKGQGWRNSVRHNLSLNECFIKAGRCEDGKGNYWAIHPDNRQDFAKGDFRQRRRGRRNRRRMLAHPTSDTLYPGAQQVFGASPIIQDASSLPSIFNPYTEAERNAYNLNEAFNRWRRPAYASNEVQACSTENFEPNANVTSWAGWDPTYASQWTTSTSSYMAALPSLTTTLASGTIQPSSVPSTPLTAALATPHQPATAQPGTTSYVPYHQS